MEEWRPCFEAYEISNLGNCRRMCRNNRYKPVRGSINNRGYRYFQTHRGGKRINKMFHQLVAAAFIGERPAGLVVDHIDRTPLNNKATNLRYITQQQNTMNTDRYRDDIKEPNRKKRNTIMARESAVKTRAAGTYQCTLCDFCYTSQKKLNRHTDGYRHKLKAECKAELGDSWKEHYRLWKGRRQDRRRRKP